MIRTLLVLTLLLPGLLCAQLESPVGIELNGTSEADRQVSGLAFPNEPDAAMSLDAVRSGATTSTVVTGTMALTGSLSPVPASLVPGMLVTVIPTEANTAGASLDLNGFGPFPIVKWGGAPVDSADLTTGVPTRLIFDGTRYHVINDLARPCPVGTSAGGALFCIGDSTIAEASFFNAVAACNSRGGRLCTFGEWASTCHRHPGFLATVNAYEWVDDAANNSNDAKTVGGGYAGPDIMEGFACEYGDTRAPQLVNRYRCCFDR